MQVLLIVALSVAAAVVYGIAHDNVTARVCIEYFTIGHPPIIESQSPTALVFTWGVVATWWVGLPLGALLAGAARIGSRPKRRAGDLVRPIAVLLVTMALLATLAGVIGFTLSRAESVWLVGPIGEAVTADRHDLDLADLWAHNAAYLAGGIGGLVLAIRTWIARGRAAEAASTATAS